VSYTVTRPVEFPGTELEARQNRQTHRFIATDYDEDGPQDFRCMECDCKPGSMTSRYPCGSNVPRETITVGE